MAINSNILKRPSDRGLFMAAAIAFPLLVLIGYFKSYYFSAFFADAPQIANKLVHAHGITMTAWVIFFIVQFALVRTKNIKLHMAMGFGGIALAALVVVVGMATAYDAQLVRHAAPPGINPHGFFLLPVSDMSIFVLFFAGAIYYRKRPAEHKALMLLTAINFLPAALFRIPLFAPEAQPLFAFGVPALMALAALAWHTAKHRRLNKIFAAGVFLLVAMVPLRFVIMESQTWLDLVARIAP
jgi:hypothetical protein